MNSKWEIVPSYGTFYVERFDNSGNWIESYREYDKVFKRLMPRGFSFSEWSDGIPQRIAEQLNEEL